MLRSALGSSLVLALLAAGPARADVLHLADGTAVEGVRVGTAAGEVHLQTEGGLRRIPAERVVRIEEAPVDDDLARRAERSRERFLRRRGREVERLLRRHGRADPGERAAIEAELGEFEAAALVEPLEEALDDADAETRALAVERLSELPDAAGVDPLVRAALTTDRDDVRLPAHRAAVAADAERVRSIYEAVAASDTKPVRRYKALHLLGVMKSAEAIPQLIYALEVIETQVRATQATAGDLRRVPVDLGASGAAGTDVPVELPQAQLVKINTASRVVALRQLRGKAAQVLRTITGEDLGADPDAWRRWLEEDRRRTHDAPR